MSYVIKWQYHQWSIDQFQREAASINCDPEWQRQDVDTLFKSDGSMSKAQSIIHSILYGLDIGEIKLAYYKGKRSSVDGGNRKRAILAFLNNKFKLHKNSGYGEKTFGDLECDIQDLIRDYHLRVIIYDDLPACAVGALFRTTNTVTPVNQQEMRNSYGDDLLATLVRRTVRRIPEVGNSTHELYDNNGNDVDPRYKYLAFNNHRLRMEDQLARIVHRVINDEKAGPSPDKALNLMYDTTGPMWEKNPAEKAKVEKKLKDALDFFLKVATSARARRNGQGLTIRQFSLLTRLYFYLKETYGVFKVNNYDEFWDQLAKATVAIEKRRDLVNLGNGLDSDRTVGEAFSKYLSFDRPEEWKHKATINWILEEFDPLNVITVKDPKRCYTAKQIEDRLIEQNWKDYIDGKPLKLKDAVGAHKVAHTNGGKTTLDNLVVVSAAHNTAMGSTDVETYKQWYIRDLKKAS